ncbi:hypothetical protein [Streptomyces chartreusis]|uniref:hypothetical protein n=1 Tax=Streptomyces chartreusis TaxID=1969 RepID=UPI0037FA6025
MNDHTQPPAPRNPEPLPADIDEAFRTHYEALSARRKEAAQTREERARTHIKAAAGTIKEQEPGQLAQPAGLFMSGMLTGLTASLEILDGGTAEGALENVNTQLAAAIGTAYLAGTLPAQLPAAAAATDHQLTREEEIRGVQAWMATDLQQALGLPVDERAAHQGYGSWADWWAGLCGRVRQRTYAELTHTRALTEPEDITTDHLLYLRGLTRGLLPEPGEMFFPASYDAIRAEAHPVTPNDPPYVIDMVGVTDGDPMREVTRRLIVHRSLATRLARDLVKLDDPEVQSAPADELARVDAILRDCGIEHPLGARGVKDLASMAKGRLEDLRRTEGERDGAYGERAHLVALLAAMTDGAVIAPAPDVDEPGWQIVYLFIRGGQASWHISPRDAGLFEDIEHVSADDPRAQWDGHTTEEKYGRIRRLTTQLARKCGPACAEGHTCTGRCEAAKER